MKIDIVTAFVNMFESPVNEGIIKIAKSKGLLNLNVHDLRSYTTDKHRQIDDTPYGGGPGMLLKIEPFHRAVEDLKNKNTHKAHVVLLTPQGQLLKQDKVQAIADNKHLILLCGHYEGVDERVRRLADEEISIGDYVLSGGELPALVLIDAISRKLDGALGCQESLVEESFEKGLLEYPQYTKPSEFMGSNVPQVLLSGNHAKINEWREEKATERTKKRRPDLTSF